MGGGASSGGEMLTPRTQEEISKLSETARKELEEKKKLADELAEEKKKLADELADEKKHAEEMGNSYRADEGGRWRHQARQGAALGGRRGGGEQNQGAGERRAGGHCTFEALDKHQVMDLPEGMPKYQDLKRDKPSIFVQVTISLPRPARQTRQGDPHHLAPLMAEDCRR